MGRGYTRALRFLLNVVAREEHMNPTTSDTARIPNGQFDSRALAPEDRFDAWREAVASVGEARLPRGAQASEFLVRSSLWNFGGMLLSLGSFTAQSQLRSRRKIRADQIDHYRVVLRMRGELESDADGRRRRIGAGRILLTDLSRPEAYDGQAGASLLLYLPREKLDALLPRPLDLHGAQPQGASARLLADYLGSLASRLEEFTLDDAPGVVDATLHMVAAALAPVAGTLEAARPFIDSTLLRQARDFVEVHLTEAELSPDQISRFCRISRTTLYRLFEPLGGVAQYVKERRLLRIHDLLVSSSGRINLGQMAWNHGFRNAEHFSRAFRRRFGYNASDLQAGQVRAPVSASARHRPGEEPENWFTSLLG